MQELRQHAVNQKTARELVSLLRQESLTEGAPTLPVVRNSVRGLRNGSLNQVSEMRTRISELMPGDAVLLLGGERTAILRLIVGGHEVRNNPEDPFGDFVAPLLVMILLVCVSTIGRICNTALGVPGQDDQEQGENRKPRGLRRGCRFLSAELESFVRMASVLHDFSTLQLWQHCQCNAQLGRTKLYHEFRRPELAESLCTAHGSLICDGLLIVGHAGNLAVRSPP